MLRGFMPSNEDRRFCFAAFVLPASRIGDISLPVFTTTSLELDYATD